MSDQIAFERNDKGLTTALQTSAENPCLEFCEGQFLFKMRNAAGGHQERFVSSAAVREAFSHIPVDSGWLAPEVVRWGNGMRGEWAVAFIPPGLHELELTSENLGQANTPYEVTSNVERITAPLPGLVFFGLRNNYFIWAVKTPTLNPDHEIYRCPLPNVETSGRVCWGPFKPPMASPRSILEASQLFIKSTFNNHFANGKSKQQREDVRLVLRELAAAVPEYVQEVCGMAYPVSDLVRQVEHVGVTLDRAVREFFETGTMPQ